MRHEAIYATHLNVTSIDDDTGAFDRDGNPVEIDESKVTTEISRLEKEYSDNEYARDRALAYDSIGNQLDLLFHDMTAGKGTKFGEWYKAIAKVKADNPKG